MSTLFFLQHPWERHRRTGPDTQPPDGTAPFFCYLERNTCWQTGYEII
jgi:hypothetical protein